MGAWLGDHSKSINVFTTFLLVLLCAISYLLLILVFLIPQSLHVRSLVGVDDSFLKPTVAVGLLSTLLLGATSALITRAVEHSLWLRIAARGSGTSRLTVNESRRLAQWSVSPLARAIYLFTGSSLLVRLGGAALLATAVLNPVLLYGIVPIEDVSGTSRVVAPSSRSAFAGFLDQSNSLFNSGNFRDVLMSTAGIAQMSNVTAPSSPLCNDARCALTARAATLQATCNSYQYDNPDRIGLKSAISPLNATLCSSARPDLCLTIVKSDPATFANFTSDYPPECGNTCSGEWADLFGVWVNSGNNPSLDDPLPIHTVECRVSFGNVTISQNGSTTPKLDRTSFTKSSFPMVTYGGNAFQWHRIYSREDGDCSPYSFVGLVFGAAGSINLYDNPFASSLLNYGSKVSSDSFTVARRIETNFDTATLFAFARASDTAAVTINTTSSTGVWRYDWRVLLILLLPFLAKVTVMSICWRVGDNETVIGYDPVDISRRGRIYLEDASDVQYSQVTERFKA